MKSSYTNPIKCSKMQPTDIVATGVETNGNSLCVKSLAGTIDNLNTHEQVERIVQDDTVSKLIFADRL